MRPGYDPSVFTAPSHRRGTNVTSFLLSLLWPAADVVACLEQTAAAAGLAPRRRAVPSAGPGPLTPRVGFGTAGAEAVAAAAAALGIDADPAAIAAHKLPRLLPRAGPALLELRGSGAGFFALLPSRRRRRLTLLGPDGRRRQAAVAELAEALRGTVAGRPASPAEAVFARLTLPRSRRARLQEVLHSSLGDQPGAVCYLLTPAAELPLGPQLRRQRLPRLTLALAACHIAQRLLLVLAWWLLARGTVRGDLPRASLAAWSLLVLSAAAAHLGEVGLGAAVLERAAPLLRRRLHAALLALDPDWLRGQGTGRLFGRILAAEALESLAVDRLPAALLALADLLLALPLLCAGAAPRAHAALLLAWSLLAALLGAAYLRAHRPAAAARIAMTHHLVEQLTGHRTRLAQESPAHRHTSEDPALAAYHGLSRRVDRRAALLRTALPRGWLLAALAALIPAVTAGPISAGPFGAALGGILLAYGAWRVLADSLLNLAEAAFAGSQIKALHERVPQDTTASRAAPDADPVAGNPFPAAHPPRTEPVLEARGLTFRRDGQPEPLLAPSTLAIRAGDRVLLSGPSGAGKSTLARLLAADLAPSGGLLLLHGLDIPTLGDAHWRRRVVLVPQLHANHLFAESLAFNLFLGRGWPPSDTDLEQAEAICRELGLGPLLDRLPAGLEQRIGEAGWQLSHGEAARVCLARALLQDPDLLILDESLAALDPAARLEVVGCICQGSRGLLLIAHA
ncbi:MAG TPA: ATP-binding cassette domain-containing protein [Thermoanaerobaculia bacterium]|nr:ATP-binding cassette domain-containing protein [Thermoanaerobaculia bacterium]